MSAFEKMKDSLVPGMVYRREDLAPFTSNVDRYLARLVEEGNLKKLKQGLYLCPATSAFGEAPPDENSLVQSFLRDDHFVIYSPNAFTQLGLGLTQLYNQRIVFNRKRHGEFNLAGRTYSFYRWREAPKEVTREFLVVELLNRLNQLAEDSDEVLRRLKEKLAQFDLRKLKLAARQYGTYSTQLKLRQLLEKERHAA